MKIGINNDYKIMQVNNITDETLTVIEFQPNAVNEWGMLEVNNPFEGWSEERLLGYCYEITLDGVEKIYPQKISK